MESNFLQLSYALDTFYFLVSAVFVMWMAAGFAMLEAGLVRSKNTVEILSKNALLYSVACTTYLFVGYNVMYPGDPISSFLPNLSFLLGADNTVEAVIAGGDDAPYYSAMSDFIFQAVFAAATMSIVSGAVAERMKLWPFLVCGGDDSRYLSNGRLLKLLVRSARLPRLCRFGCGSYGRCRSSACSRDYGWPSLRSLWAERPVRYSGSKPTDGNLGYVYPMDGLVRL
ncbi:membrane hypothetical protein [uncultured Thiomicrorhabdus sp.]